MTVYDDVGIPWTFDPTLNENGYPTLSGYDMTVEIADPGIADSLATLFLAMQITDQVGPPLEAAARAWEDSACGQWGCNQYSRAIGDSVQMSRPAGARQHSRYEMHWRVRGRGWQPPLDSAHAASLPWQPPRRPGPSQWLEWGEFVSFSTPALFQFGYSCGDIAGASIIAHNDYQNHRFSLKSALFVELRLYGAYKLDQAPGQYFRIVRDFLDEQGWRLWSPKGLVSMVWTTASWYAYVTLVNTVDVAFLTTMWNGMHCGSQDVTISEALLVGDPPTSNGVMNLVCFYQWVDIALASGTYQVHAWVCESTT